MRSMFSLPSLSHLSFQTHALAYRAALTDRAVPAIASAAMDTLDPTALLFLEVSGLLSSLAPFHCVSRSLSCLLFLTLFVLFLESDTYTWSVAWTPCTKTCGGGTMTSTVSCTSSTGLTVDDTQCNAASKPAVQTVACNSLPCRECSVKRFAHFAHSSVSNFAVISSSRVQRTVWLR